MKTEGADLILYKTHYSFVTMHEKFTYLIMKFDINDAYPFVSARLSQILFSNLSTDFNFTSFELYTLRVRFADNDTTRFV